VYTKKKVTDSHPHQAARHMNYVEINK